MARRVRRKYLEGIGGRRRLRAPALRRRRGSRLMPVILPVPGPKPRPVSPPKDFKERARERAREYARRRGQSRPVRMPRVIPGPAAPEIHVPSSRRAPKRSPKPRPRPVLTPASLLERTQKRSSPRGKRPFRWQPDVGGRRKALRMPVRKRKTAGR